MEFGWIIAPLVGGLLIGGASAITLAANGRIAGTSGILAGTMRPTDDRGDRVAFLVGLLAVGAVAPFVMPSAFEGGVDRSYPALILAGLLVGFGTQLGNGCTSGHGVCGLSRGSPRSMVATGTFMLTGGIAAFVVGHLLGGAL